MSVRQDSSFLWFIPSFFGDVRLMEPREGTTLISYEKLTEGEKTALKALADHANKKKWGSGLLSDPPTATGHFTLEADIVEVQKFLSKALKPDRRIVSVIYREGQMEEVIDAKTKKGEIVTSKGSRSKKGAKGASIAAPVRGCPEPDFVKAEIRATEVLRAFLNKEQQQDFARWNRFVTVGASGEKYMVTSRHAKDELSKYHRSLYALGMDLPICTHDWEIPAGEEMLTFHILVQLPEWEAWLRQRPNVVDGSL